jgi:hypothetical protein
MRRVALSIATTFAFSVAVRVISALPGFCVEV